MHVYALARMGSSYVDVSLCFVSPPPHVIPFYVTLFTKKNNCHRANEKAEMYQIMSISIKIDCISGSSRWYMVNKS